MLCAGAGGIKQNGTILAIDNVSLYAPQPVKVKKVSITANGQESYDLADIPADVEAITIYFSAQQGFVPAADGIDQAIGLYTQDGKQIPAAGQYDEEQMAYTIRPKTLLESGIVYQIGIDGVTDNIYHTRYERTLQIKTNETPVPFVLSEVTAEKDGTVYTDLLKLPAGYEKISLYFITPAWMRNRRGGHRVPISSLVDCRRTNYCGHRGFDRSCLYPYLIAELGV